MKEFLPLNVLVPPIMKMQNACATLFKIKIGFRFPIWI